VLQSAANLSIEMIAGGNHTKIKKLDFLAIGSSEPIAKKD